MQQIKGEATCLKAFRYYLMCGLWGDVPYYDEAARWGDVIDKPRTDKNIIYSRVLQQLVDIEPNMKWSDVKAYRKPMISPTASAVEYQRANRPKNGQVDDILKVNRKNATLSYRVGEWGYFVLDRARRKYYQDLIFDLNPKKFQKSLHHFWTRPGFDEYPNFGKVDSAAYDFRYNVALPVETHLGALSVDTSITYRYDELHTMITLCREHCVDITFVIGPYNRIALQKTCPEEVANLETVCRNIKQMCQQEGVPYIDATDLSSRLGAFNDYQHHSSYGAYLIYQKIKEYVLEKENR